MKKTNSNREYLPKHSIGHAVAKQEMLPDFDYAELNESIADAISDDELDFDFDYKGNIGEKSDRDLNVAEDKLLQSGEDVGAKMVKGATILAIAGIIAKVLGAFFRIPLTNLIGGEGMSYYGVAYPVYAFFYVLATAGLPVAISRMVSERIALNDYRNAHRSYKISMYMMTAVGAVSFLFVFFGAEFISTRIGNPGAAMSLKAIAPAIMIAPIVASFRGYFQGQQNMTPTAVSQVFEQLARVAIGLALSFILVKKGLEYASAGATFGATAGLLVALVVVGIVYLSRRGEIKARLQQSIDRTESRGSLIKEFFSIAIPVTIGSSVLPLMLIIDAAIIMNRLQATGWSLEMSKTLYGLISAYCDSLVGFPAVFIDAVSISILPAITAAYTLKKNEELKATIQTGIKTMMILAFPCAVGLIVMARPVLYLLYPAQIEEAEMAVSTLQILSVGIITLAVMRTFSSSLQGIGRIVLPVVNLLIGAVVKIVISYILVGIPTLNIKGAAIGNVVAYLIAAILNYSALKKYADIKIKTYDTFVKPFIASALMGVITWGLYYVLNLKFGYSAVTTLGTIMLAVLVYFVLIFVTKTVTREEAMLLPKGELIVKLAVKLHLICEVKDEVR